MSLKLVYEIDSDGFLIESHVTEVDETGKVIDENKQHYVTKEIKTGFYKAKWTGIEWVEDKTQAEFEEDAFLESLIPNAEEIVNAEFEIKILDILMEVELI